ncbi:hypothetical protein RUM43_013914 [Polyplax serrata]|uniref:Uncharacterized protein n=1 Tax=Polyplax serrata TaxID=468196 RepID=A0AAN8PH60_POLSC
MGGYKKPNGLRKPVIYHSSIPAHIRSLAQNITGGKTTAKNCTAGSSLDQSVGFVAESPTKTVKKVASVKRTVKLSADGEKKKPVTKCDNAISPTLPTATKRPTSLQTNVSSGYESEYQSSEVGSSWDWTAAEIIWKWQNNNLKTKKVGRVHDTSDSYECLSRVYTTI